MRRIVVFSGLLAILAVGGSGCSLAPRSFRDMLHPAPIVRARSVGLGEKQPESVAVPAMIARLNDPDEVVRMTAFDGLKERTGRDFGFVPWAPAPERATALARWQAWWKVRSAQAAYPKDDELRKVAIRPARGRRKAGDGGQGGPRTSWPASNPPDPSIPPTASTP